MNFFSNLFSHVVSGICLAISIGFFFHFLGKDTTKSIWSGLAVWVFIGLSIALYVHNKANSETQTSGVLKPSNLSTPSNPCSGSVPEKAITLIFGKMATYTTKTPHTVLRYKDEDLLIIDKKENGMSISAKFRSRDKKIVAELIDNKFVINPNNYFRKDRPNKSTLIVFDQEGTEILNIQYLNELAMQLSGIFYLPQRPPLILGDFGGTICFGENKYDIVIE